MNKILSWLVGGGIAAIGEQLNNAYRMKLEAENDSDRIHAEEQIAYFKGQMELAIAASQNDKWWSTREMIGKCVFLYVFKIVVWDTVLGLGVTPDPGPVVGGIVSITIAFYFGQKALSDIATKMMFRRR